MVVFKKTSLTDPTLRALLDRPDSPSRRDLRQYSPKLYSLVGSLAGAIDLYVSKGRLIARSWPKKPKQPNSRAQLLARRAFSVMCSNWSYLGGEDKKAWVNRAKGGQRIPRDLFGKEFLKFWFAYNFWPIVFHLQTSEAFGGGINISGHTQYDCYSELHYSHGQELKNFDIVTWWNEYCESGGLFFGANVANFFALKHFIPSTWGFDSMQQFIINHYDPDFYPMIYIVINKDVHGRVNGCSGLYCVSWHQNTSHPPEIVDEKHGKLDPIRDWAYVNLDAWRFPTVPDIL